MAITGLDRLTARREARRWRPLALLIIDRLNGGMDGFEDILEARILGYCIKAYGAYEIPEGREYLDLLLEGLRDPETWESDGEVPSLLDVLGASVEKSEAKLETRAPLLVADSRLAEIGAYVTQIHNLADSAFRALTWIWIDINSVLSVPLEKRVRHQLAVVEVILVYREIVKTFRRRVDEFRGPRVGHQIVSDEALRSRLAEIG